jgi:Family of unknown function (DUF6527)
MKRISQLRHEFVRAMPERLQSGVVYVSLDYATCAHLCCCGCGREVVTPLTPTDWKVIFDGETVSLHPSVGNWNFGCRSHYWIKRGYVKWAAPWTPEEIAANRARDRHAKSIYFGDQITTAEPAPAPSTSQAASGEGFLAKLSRWLRQS